MLGVRTLLKKKQFTNIRVHWRLDLSAETDQYLSFFDKNTSYLFEMTERTN